MLRASQEYNRFKKIRSLALGKKITLQYGILATELTRQLYTQLPGYSLLLPFCFAHSGESRIFRHYPVMTDQHLLFPWSPKQLCHLWHKSAL